MVSPSKNNAIN